jgi:hypothetical protein
MLEAFTLAATSAPSCSLLLYQRMLGLLLCPAKSTLTKIICAKGGQHSDWPADYRFYSKERVAESVLFGRVRDSLIDNLAPDEPLVVAVDDTIAHKTGQKYMAAHGNAIHSVRPGTFYHFVNDTPSNTNAQKLTPDLPAILFAAA